MRISGKTLQDVLDILGNELHNAFLDHGIGYVYGKNNSRNLK